MINKYGASVSPCSIPGVVIKDFVEPSGVPIINDGLS